MLLLQILSGSKTGSTIPVSLFPFSIGRSPSSHFSVSDPGLWEQHADIRLESPANVVLTVAPNALAMVNNESVTKSVLRNGDIVSLGSTRFQIFLSPARVGNFRTREVLTWIGFGLLCIVQIALIYSLL